MGYQIGKEEEREEDFTITSAASEPLEDLEENEEVPFETPEETAPAWKEIPVLSNLDVKEAAALADRLTTLWLAPDEEREPTEEEKADAETLKAVHDEAGHQGFISFLQTFPGAPADLAALLGTVEFLNNAVEPIRSATRYKKQEVISTADELNELMFEGKFEEGRERAVEALTFLWKSLDESKSKSKFANRLREGANSLQTEVAMLLVELNAPVPDNTQQR